MANNKEAFKMAAFVFLQFALLLSFILQLHGIMVTDKLLEMRRNMLLSAYFSVPRSNLRRKRKHLQARLLNRKKRSIWVVNGRTEQWWKNLIGTDVPDSCWKKNLRIFKESFYQLANELRPFIAPKPGSPNYRYLTTEKKIALTLYYLKNTGSLWMTANTFGVHQCTVSKTIVEVCTAINTHLGPKYLHLPNDVDEMRRKVSEFELKFGMKEGKLPSTYNFVLPGFEAVPNYLIGDPAYPLTPFCMKEFQTCATNDQVIFNNMLRSARN